MLNYSTPGVKIQPQPTRQRWIDVDSTHF